MTWIGGVSKGRGHNNGFHGKQTKEKAHRILDQVSLPIARELRDLHHGPILEIPIVVLTRGKRVWPDTPYGDAMEAAWTELQDELNYLSDHSTHIIAENSGHVIHLDEPELVLDAIHDVLSYVEKELDEQGG